MANYFQTDRKLVQENTGCDFCGTDNADGYWVGKKNNVSICKSCAVSVLPSLCADTLCSGSYTFDHMETFDQLQRSLAEFERKFWRSAFLCYERCELYNIPGGDTFDDDESIKDEPVVYKTKRQMTPKMRFEVLRRDGFKCQYCGKGDEEAKQLHVDHIHPISKGGDNSMDNLITACRECNLGKSDTEII